MFHLFLVCLSLLLCHLILTGSSKLCLSVAKGCLHSVLVVPQWVQTCTPISLVSSTLRRVLIHTMITRLCKILPVLMWTLVMMLFVVVHVKTVSSCSTCKMPTFRLPTPRAAQ